MRFVFEAIGYVLAIIGVLLLIFLTWKFLLWVD